VTTVRSAGAVLLSYLDQQLAQIDAQVPLVRADAPDSVHKMRVAARRARSALATYAPLLGPGAADQLRDDLRWLGLALGPARDQEVLRARFEALLSELPDSPGRALAGRRIADELERRYGAGPAVTQEALDSARFARLVGDLRQFIDAPPFEERAARPATAELVRLVGRDWRLLSRRVAAAEAVTGREERDLALHAVRKAAKRLRYAAESAAAVLGEPAEELAESCAHLQDALGEQHDSAVARDLLGAMAAEAASVGESHRTFDDLQSREKDRTVDSENRSEAALLVLTAGHRRRWLRQDPTTRRGTTTASP
jgi:CHAD domain-containing protein